MAVNSFCIRSAMPGNIEVPPDNTTLPYKSVRISTLHFMMELSVVSWIPAASIPRKDGASGQRNRSLPIFSALSIAIKSLLSLFKIINSMMFPCFKYPKKLIFLFYEKN